MKTAEELQLSQEEFDALIKVRNMLNETPFEHTDVVFDNDYKRKRHAEWVERGSKPYEDPYLFHTPVMQLDGFGGFNMTQMCRPYNPSDDDEFRDYYECGTVGCIAGWMGVFMWSKPPVVGKKYALDFDTARRIALFVNDFDDYPRKYSNPDDPYHEWKLNGTRQLFYPCDADGKCVMRPWDDITPAEAVRAIDNFLEHGEPRWHEVLGEAHSPILSTEDAS